MSEENSGQAFAVFKSHETPPPVVFFIMGAKTSEETRERILALRADGKTLKAIVSEVGASYATVQKIAKEAKPKPPPSPPPTDIIRQARILRPYPNPRLVAIYFGEQRTDAETGKLVVRPGRNYRPGSQLRVKLVDGEQGLYRIA